MNLNVFLATILVAFCCFFCANSIEFNRGLKDKPVHKCILDGTNCTFNNVILNSTHYEWQPTSDNPVFVQAVAFSSSVIPVVTKGICETFPNLQLLHMNNLQVEKVEENAFDACSELNVIKLQFNKIQRLHPNTFMNTKKINILLLYGNRISELDNYQIFANMPDLHYLNLEKNKLTEFSPKLIRNNKNLGTLWLNSNDLSDIEAEQIFEFHPKLSYFYMNDNEMSCTRVVEICNMLTSKGITCHIFSGDKVRYYEQQYVFGKLECNPDVSWMASNYRKQNSVIHRKFEEFQKVSDQNLKQLLETDERLSKQNEMISQVDHRINKLEERFDRIENNIQKLVDLISNP